MSNDRFLAMFVNEDANTVKRKDCNKCPNKREKQITEKCNNA